jgi:hypothetical protein
MERCLAVPEVNKQKTVLNKVIASIKKAAAPKL